MLHCSRSLISGHQRQLTSRRRSAALKALDARQRPMATAQASCNATEPGGASWEVMRILIYGMYIGYKIYISKKYDIYIYSSFYI